MIEFTSISNSVNMKLCLNIVNRFLSPVFFEFIKSEKTWCNYKKKKYRRRKCLAGG